MEKKLKIGQLYFSMWDKNGQTYFRRDRKIENRNKFKFRDDGGRVVWKNI